MAEELAMALADEIMELCARHYALPIMPQRDDEALARALARALIAAGYAKRSDVVEECAKVADDYDTGGFGQHKNMSVSAIAAEEIAALIRNLKDKP